MITIHKKRATKSAVSFLLALILTVSASTFEPVRADTLSDLKNKYQELQSKQEKLQQQLNTLNSKVSSEKEKKEAISSNIATINEQISVLNSQVSQLGSDIESTNKSIADTQKQIETNTKIYKERVCAIYEAGKTSKLEVLLTSNSLADFLTKMETLKVVEEHDTKLINDLKEESAKLAAQKKTLEEKRASLEESKATIDAKKQVVQTQLAEQKKIIANLENDAFCVSNTKSEVKAQQEKTDDQIDAEVERLAEIRRKQLEEQRKQQQSSSGNSSGSSGGSTSGSGSSSGSLSGSSSGSISVSASAIIGYAKGLLGTPYLLNSANPSNGGIDCSGFVQYVFANVAGITIKRRAIEQASMGTYVSKSNLQPGDLVFFATEGGSKVTHVGIYIGNDRFIAANSGTMRDVGVSIAPLFSDSYWGPRYVTARRLL